MVRLRPAFPANPYRRLIRTVPAKSISINRTTGIFTGNVKKDGISSSYQGAISQGDNNGFGQHFRNKLTGPVFLSDTLTPEPQCLERRVEELREKLFTIFNPEAQGLRGHPPGENKP